MRSAHLLIAIAISCIAVGCGGGSGSKPVTLEDQLLRSRQEPPAPVASSEPAVADVRSEPRELPSDLKGRLEMYRRDLVASGHLWTRDVAERYADTKIASLRQQFAGNDEALIAELGRLLTAETARHPGAAPTTVPQK
jgi:hypothetical protein